MTQNSKEKITKVSQKAWQLAEILRGAYKKHEYRLVMLPLIALLRWDSALRPTKQHVLDGLENAPQIERLKDKYLQDLSGLSFYNTSQFNMLTLRDDVNNVKENFKDYLGKFSPNLEDILSKFEFEKQVEKLASKDLLFKVIEELTDPNKGIDVSIENISNHEMGKIYEALIRKFNEYSNETSGDHFTPSEVIELITSILISEADDLLTNTNKLIKIYDPTVGTGGMLSTAQEKLVQYNSSLNVELYGQELNDETYAICKADMLLKGNDRSEIRLGNTLTQDFFKDEKFVYMMANPPYGVDWKKDKDEIAELEKEQGDKRFPHGKPRTSDGQLLFLEHMISKMDATGSQIGIVLNGSPLFTGDAGSGESNIRRSIIENDLLECIIALPDQMFYNTGINTYIWILSNDKPSNKRGKIQLINAVDMFETQKNEGDKRHKISDVQLKEIVRLFFTFDDKDERVKIFNNNEFAFIKLTIEKPITASQLQQHDKIEVVAEYQEQLIEKLQEIEKHKISFGSKDDFSKFLGVKLKANQLKILIGTDSESIPLTMDIPENGLPLGYDKKSSIDEIQELTHPLCEKYLQKEVYPHVPSAWADYSKIRIGYEIPFTRYFFKYQPPRPPEEIQIELETVENHIATLLTQLKNRGFHEYTK